MTILDPRHSKVIVTRLDYGSRIEDVGREFLWSREPLRRLRS